MWSEDNFQYAVENIEVILTADRYSRLLLEGFGEKAARYIEQPREYAQQFAVVRYGFQFRKTGVKEKTVRASMASVIEQTKALVNRAEEPLSAVI